jgi:hypothetical protein
VIQGAAKNLAVTRIVFYALVLFVMAADSYFLNWTRVPDAFWHPRGLFRLLDGPVDDAVIAFWFYVWRWTLPLCVLGVFFRIVAPLNLIAAFVVLTNAHSWGYQGHVFMPVLLACIPIAFSRASDVLSFDAWWKRRRGQGDSLLAQDEKVYRIPLRTMQLALCLAYFAAGVAKLRYGGIEWITGDTLRNYLMRASLIFYDVNRLANEFQLNLFLYQYPVLCRFLAVFAVGVELAIPLALLSRRLAYVLVPSVFLLQVGIFFTIYVNFSAYTALFVPWVVPWVVPWAKRLVGTKWERRRH